MKYGYARVSTKGQDLQAQINALKEEGCEKVFAEKITGTKAEV
jgi:DNA invertase Pin-like site-specific DNA recombinase